MYKVKHAAHGTKYTMPDFSRLSTGSLTLERSWPIVQEDLKNTHSLSGARTGLRDSEMPHMYMYGRTTVVHQTGCSLVNSGAWKRKGGGS